MGRVIDFFARRRAGDAQRRDGGAMLDGFSLEVTPRSAEAVDRFDAILPAGSRVYIAHIDGCATDPLVATARRLREQGMTPMPHIPARSIPDAAALADLLARYRDEAGVTGALLLGGGAPRRAGAFGSVMDMVGTGLFDRAGFAMLHVAGHPEGNRDIDPDGGERAAMAALRWKQGMRERTGAEMAIVTQFAFEAEPVIAWTERLAAAGVDLPVHVGVAGPAKLQTLIKYALACGVGPSLRVLKRRAADVTQLMLPHAPDAVLAALAAHRAANAASPLRAAHIFPFGGIAASADYAAGRTADAASASQRA